MPSLFLEELSGLRDLLEGRDLEIAQREINPLTRKGDNPVKQVVKKTRKALRTRKRSDFSSAATAHNKAIVFAQGEGLPRLKSQLRRHQRDLEKLLKKQKKISSRKSHT